MSRVFLIDYGATEISESKLKTLTPDDTVVLFYTDKDSLQIEIVSALENCSASIDYQKVDSRDNVTVVLQMTAYLFYHVWEGAEVIIVSDHTTFDSAIEMGRRMGVNNIRRLTSGALKRKIKPQKPAKPQKPEKSMIPEEEEEIEIPDVDISGMEFEDALIALGVEPSVTTTAYIKLAFWNSSTKEELSRYLRKTIGQKQGREIYQRLKGHAKEIDELVAIK